jgi:hypothetical protein
MAETRLQTLETRLENYLKCEEAILSGAQSYQIGSRQMTKANLYHIKDMIKYLENEIEQEKSRIAGKGRNKSFGVIPRDF